jgi:hypothetical protein
MNPWLGFDEILGSYDGFAKRTAEKRNALQKTQSGGAASAMGPSPWPMGLAGNISSKSSELLSIFVLKARPQILL